MKQFICRVKSNLLCLAKSKPIKALAESLVSGKASFESLLTMGQFDDSIGKHRSKIHRRLIILRLEDFMKHYEHLYCTTKPFLFNHTFAYPSHKQTFC